MRRGVRWRAPREARAAIIAAPLAQLARDGT